MREKKFRHEYKYFITYSDYLSVKSRLSAIADFDAHAKNSGKYFIRSLYFDNIYDKALREKIDGVNCREKFRIRFYNGNSDFIRLEKKSKINGLCNKISAPLTRKETERILNGNLEWMLTSKRALVTELYSKMHSQLLRPKTIVDYTREPFVYKAGNVRITFDYDIKTGIYSRDIFNSRCPTVPAADESILMEIKFDEFLPSVIRDIIQLDSRRAQAFSKYGACRIYG